jgi:hypothetical protein
MASPRRHSSRRVLTLVLVLATLALAALVLHSGLSAQAISPTVVIDKTGFFAGETVTISGAGFTPDETVTLQVTHADGGAEPGGNHDAFTAIADAAGAFSSTWALGQGANEDFAGNNFVLTASRVPAGALPPILFYRAAIVGTDKYDYAWLL